MPFKRTEAEVRELLAAVKAVGEQERACMCETCEEDLRITIQVIDLLSWLLGDNEVTPEFAAYYGTGCNFDFHFVQKLIMDHKLGVFDIRHSGGN